MVESVETLCMPVKLPRPSRQYLRDFRWIESRIGRLACEYPNQWVAVHKARVVASGEDLGKIKAAIRKQFGDEEVPVHFVDDGTIILGC
ncbi:MAG: hypothetical protein HY718_05515 [Planctomycetes bacterium]|nr:hypothetical protein [Planctomycetota bacterium]